MQDILKYAVLKRAPRPIAINRNIRRKRYILILRPPTHTTVSQQLDLKDKPKLLTTLNLKPSSSPYSWEVAFTL